MVEEFHELKDRINKINDIIENTITANGDT